MIRGPAVRDQDPGELPEERPCRHRAPPGVDQEDRHKRRAGDPQPRFLPTLTPTGLVGVHDGLALDVLAGLGDGLCHRGAHRLFGGGHRSERQRDTEQVRERRLRGPLAHVVAAGEERDHRLHPRAERASRDFGRQLALGRVTAFVALLDVRAVLGDVRLDLRHFGDLMALRTSNLHSEGGVHRRPAILTVRRPVIDDFVHLLGRQQLAVRAFVPWLSTWLTSRWLLLRRQLQRWRIARRRLRDEFREFCASRRST